MLIICMVVRNGWWKKIFLNSIQGFYLTTLENNSVTACNHAVVKHMKDGVGYDTSKSDHKTVTRKHKGSNCRESTVTAAVWAWFSTSTPHIWAGLSDKIYICQKLGASWGLWIWLGEFLKVELRYFQ